MILEANGFFYSPDPITPTIIRDNAFRSIMHPTHLQTFYAWLFKEISIEDLMYEGNFFPMTWDLAMMVPMMEMAAVRHVFIPEVIYIYNVANSINDNKMDLQFQKNLEQIIRKLQPYKRLEINPLSDGFFIK